MMSDKLIAIHKHTDNRNRGYTLIEVMIAIAIFSIGFLAVGSMQIRATRTGVSSRNQTTVLSRGPQKTPRKCLHREYQARSGGLHGFTSD